VIFDDDEAAAFAATDTIVEDEEEEGNDRGVTQRPSRRRGSSRGDSDALTPGPLFVGEDPRET